MKKSLLPVLGLVLLSTCALLASGNLPGGLGNLPEAAGNLPAGGRDGVDSKALFSRSDRQVAGQVGRVARATQAGHLAFQCEAPSLREFPGMLSPSAPVNTPRPTLDASHPSLLWALLSFLPMMGAVADSAFLAGIKTQIGGLRTKANEWLAKLKPLEQQEGAEQLNYVFSRLQNAHQELCDILNWTEEKVSGAYEQAMQALKADPQMREEIKQQILQSGEYITKTDADGRVQAAEGAAKTAAKTEFEQEAQKQQTVASRRREAEVAVDEAFKGKKDAPKAQEVCSKITDETLLGDGYKTAIAGVVERVKKCATVGVIKSEVLQEVCSMKSEDFDKQLGTWTDIATAARGGKPFNPLATGSERQSAGAGSGGGGGKERVLVC